MDDWGDLFRITGSKSSDITVDFSSVCIDDLTRLKDLLFHFGVLDIHGITFNLALYNSHHKSAKDIPPEDVMRFGASVYVQLPTFPQEVAAIIARLLNRARALRVLTVESIDLSFPEVDLICQGISDASCLRVVNFEKIPLFDEGFELLAGAISRQGVVSVGAVGCRLTDAITRHVAALIVKHTAIQKAVDEERFRSHRAPKLVCLSSFDFRENRLSQSFVKGIAGKVRASPIRHFDLRDNPRIPSSMRPARVFLVGPSCLDRFHKRSTTQKLRDENAKLRSRLAAFVGSKNIVMVDRDTFVVGERASELVQHINELDSLYSRLRQPRIYAH
jgi:hypothetical protein